MDSVLRDLVRKRASDRCEYCLIRQEDVPIPRLHVEHIVARKHGGKSTPENLALACIHCNLHKGTNLTGIDHATNLVTRLFHPRQDSWHDHFQIDGPRIEGKTPAGRTTVVVLGMNAGDRIQLRAKLLTLGFQ